ncbi:hypothetical protein ACPCTH_05705 [Streptomyces cellulosae]
MIDDRVDRLPPRGHGLFPGVGEPDHLTRGGRVRVRAWLRYGDCRDWPAVDTAAREISGGTDRRRHEKAEETQYRLSGDARRGLRAAAHDRCD